MANWPLAIIHHALEAIEFVAFDDLLGRMVREHGFAIYDGPHSFTQTHIDRRAAECIQRACRAASSHLEYMGVHHGDENIRVAQQVLHCTEARCIGKALCGLQKLGHLASMRELICMCTRWLTEGLGPLPRYDLMPQMGESLLAPYRDRLNF